MKCTMAVQGIDERKISSLVPYCCVMVVLLPLINQNIPNTVIYLLKFMKSKVKIHETVFNCLYITLELNSTIRCHW